jgi:DNA-binding beta-propeller fold protein YncE
MGKPTPIFPVTATAAGCSPPVPLHAGGLPTVINQHQASGSSFNFGQGPLTPTQFIVHSSGTRAYILASNLSNIIVFNFDTQSTSSIQLAGNSAPIQASLSTDGKTLYVLARDLTTKVNSVHTIDTTLNADLNQIVLSQNLCHARVNTSGTFTCDPDLIAVRP